MKQFELDVQSILRDGENESPLIAEPKESDVLLEIASLVSVPTLDTPFPCRLPAVVRYRLAPSGSLQEKSLIREVRLMTDAQRTVYESTLADSLTAATVDYHLNGQWKTERPIAERDTSIDAVRLALKWPSDQRTAVRTVVLTAPREEK